MTSVLRKVRWIALAPVRLCVAMVSGAIRGVVALGRGVAAAFAFVVQACVHAVRASFAMVTMAVTRVLRAVAALGRAIVGGIVGAAVGAARQLVAGLQAVGRGAIGTFAFVVRALVHTVRAGFAMVRTAVSRALLAVAALGRGLAAAFALVWNRAAHARRAAVSNGLSAMAGARRASVWGVNTLTASATTSAEWLRGEAARAVSVGRLAGLGATRAIHHGALVVVVALVGAAVTVGGVLPLWRGPVVQPVAADVRVEATAEPVVVPVAAVVTSPPAATARPVNRRADANRAAEPRRELSAETVRAIWRKTDTRSLDRGIAAVRTATLALHRCRVEMTASDRAVAHCDVLPAATSSSRQPRKAAWTIDFRRADERWLIEDISTAAR